MNTMLEFYQQPTSWVICRPLTQNKNNNGPATVMQINNIWKFYKSFFTTAFDIIYL